MDDVMTVEEVREVLSHYDPDTPVYFRIEVDANVAPVQDITLMKLRGTTIDFVGTDAVVLE